MVKTLNILGIQGNSPPDVTSMSVICNDKTLEAFPLTLRTRQGCSLSPFLFNVALGGLARENRQEKSNKRHPGWRRNKTTFIHR